MLSTEQISAKVEVLKRHYAERDNRMTNVLEVRRGNLETIAGEYFPESMPRAMIANFVDVAARDISEVLAPLPSFNCSVSNMNKERAKKRADTRSLIVNNYVQYSRLQSQMYTGADWYLTYGFLPFKVEADIDSAMPRIRVENPVGAYPEYDRHGRIVAYAKRYLKSVRELANEFPEYAGIIIGKDGDSEGNLESELEVVYYEDAEQIALFLPTRNNLPLTQTTNPMGKVMVRVARRPDIDPSDPRGQFDDVIYAQLARARFAWMAMDAAEKSVYAPLALPMDVQEFALGPDAVIRSSNPQAIRRVGLELPSAAFTEQSVLEAEMRMGSRYPEGRSGNIDASVITGSGVQALLGGFDTQIKAGQQVLQETLEEVASLALEMDFMLFTGIKKMTGTYQGVTYDLEYDPAKDIAGDFTVQARYGLMAGLDPSRALLFSLQALQANLVSRDFIMRELPWSMNVSYEQERIDVEKMRDSLTSSLAALSQAIPQMAMGGQDPSTVVANLAKVIDLRKQGKEIEDAVSEAFTPPPAPEPAAAQPQMPPEQLLAAMGGNVAEAPATPAAAIAQAAAPEATAPAAAPSEQAPPDIASILSALGG